MSKTEETRRMLITAESILSAILLLYLSGHVTAWDKNIENFQFYSITIYLSIILYVGCILTLFRSIVLIFQSIFSQKSTEQEELYHVGYNLFLLVLLAVSIGTFAALLSVVRQAIFSAPHTPIQIITPSWLFLFLFLLLLVYTGIIVFRPKWISRVIDYLKDP